MNRRRDRTDERPPIDWIQTACSIGMIVVTGFFYYYFYGDPRRRAIWGQLLFPDDLITDNWAGELRFFGFFDRVPVLLSASVILSAAVALGRATLRALRLSETLPVWERNTYSALLGLAWLSWATLLIGRAGLLQQRVLLICGVAAVAVAGVVLLGRDFRNWNRRFTENRTVRVCAILGAVFTVLLLSTAILPPWDFDVLEYHLQAPKEWLQLGRIEFLPHNLYASMPLAAEMLALLGMAMWPGTDGWFYGALVGKILLACFVPLTGLVIYSVGARCVSPAVGAVGGVLFVTMPWMLTTAGHGLNEPAVAAYGFLAFAALTRGDEQRVGWTILGGLAAGAAAACKYPALVMITAPLTAAAVVLPVWLDRRPFHFTTAVRDAALFLVAAAVLVGPWFLKNAVQTGNPTYPLLVSVFGGTTRTPEKDARFVRAHATPVDDSGSRFGWNPATNAFAQIFMFTEGQSPLVLAFPAGMSLIVFGARSRTSSSIVGLCLLGMVGWILLVWFVATHRIDRFWLPAVPFAALVCGIAVEQESDRFRRWSFIAFVASGMLFLFLSAIGASGDVRRFVRLDVLREGARLNDKFPVARVSAAFRYLNDHAPNAAVLLVGDAAVFDLKPRAYYNTCFDDSLLADWTVNRSADERRGALLGRKIAFVCVNFRELDRYRSPGNYGYDPRYRDEIIDELLAEGILELEWTEPESPRPTKIYRVLPAPQS